MKLGSSLSDVVQRVDRQSRDSRDFIAHSRHIRLDFDHDRNPSLVLDDGGGVQLFALTEHVHEQIADVLGIPGQYDHPGFVAAHAKVMAACRRHGKAGGCLAATPALARDWMAKGARLVMNATDVMLLTEAYRAGLAAISNGEKS